MTADTDLIDARTQQAEHAYRDAALLRRLAFHLDAYGSRIHSTDGSNASYSGERFQWKEVSALARLAIKSLAHYL